MTFDRHSDRVCAELPIHPYLGRRFVCRTRECAIDASAKEIRLRFVAPLLEPFVCDRVRLFVGDLLHAAVVNLGHIRETNAERACRVLFHDGEVAFHFGFQKTTRAHFDHPACLAMA